MASISASSLIVSTAGPFKRSASERSPPSPKPLHLQRAAERIRVVLQRNNPLHLGRLGIDQHDAAFEKFGGVGQSAHCLTFFLRGSCIAMRLFAYLFLRDPLFYGLSGLLAAMVNGVCSLTGASNSTMKGTSPVRPVASKRDRGTVATCSGRPPQ